jgi:hypothetical protein
MASGKFRTGFSNWWHGGANLGASVLGMQFFNFFKSGGFNASQMAYNKMVNGSAAVGGLSTDVVAWASPDSIPLETYCGD